MKNQAVQNNNLKQMQQKQQESQFAQRKIRNEFTEEQKQEIKEAFELYDQEGTGVIDARELKIAMRALGFEQRKDEVRRILGDIDRFEDGAIKYDEFLEILTQKNVDKEPVEEIKRAFRLMCDEGSDKITLKSLKKLIKDLGENMTDDEIAEMIEEADKDQDGEVGEEDFLRIMKKTNLF
jgi:centrin-1